MRLFLIMALLLVAPAAWGATAHMPEDGAAWVKTPSSAVTPSVIYGGNTPLPPGAVTVQEQGDATVSDSLDDYDSEPVVTIPDPLESWNRFWFRFNDIFFIHVAKPMYEGWKFITPQFFRTGMSNLFYNVLFPTRFINCLLQARPLAAGVEFSRFMMNMMGSAGMVDLASNKRTIVPMDPSGEDFGQTLGKWGFGPGCYLVWPFIGPSSVRDTFGRIGDAFTTPLFYLDPWTVSLGSNVAFRFNDLNDVLPAYEGIKSIAVDPYIAMREAYASMRRTQIAR